MIKLSPKWKALLAIAFGPLIATLDSSAMNVALPSISRYFDAHISQVEWVVVGYLLAVAALLLPFGRLGDLIGKKRIFMVGLLAFTLSSLLCALSQTITQLVLFRVLQGIGGSIFISVAPALLVDAFPATERGKAMGTMGTIVSIGLMSGAPLGGFLTDLISWRSIFFINLPIGIVGFFLSSRYIASDPETKPFQFDWIGSLLIVLCSTSFLFGLNQLVNGESGKSGELELNLGKIFFLFGLSGLCGFIFYLFERKNPFGIFDFSLLKNKFFVGGNLALFFHFMAFSVLFFLIPFYMTDVLRYSTQKTGVAMSFFCMALAFLMPLSGSISDKIGSHVIAPVGLLLVTISYWAMQHVSMETSFPTLLLGLMCVGGASGIFQAPNNSSLMGAVSKTHMGTASAMIASMRTFGLMCGTALATVIFMWRVHVHNGSFLQSGSHFSLHELPPTLFLVGFQETLWASVILALVAMGFCAMRKS